MDIVWYKINVGGKFVCYYDVHLKHKRGILSVYFLRVIPFSGFVDTTTKLQISKKLQKTKMPKRTTAMLRCKL